GCVEHDVPERAGDPGGKVDLVLRNVRQLVTHPHVAPLGVVREKTRAKGRLGKGVVDPKRERDGTRVDRVTTHGLDAEDVDSTTGELVEEHVLGAARRKRTSP